MRKNLLMAALVVSLALSGACDSTGAPVAGGTAYFTAPGSASVAVTPWANHDATASVPLVNGGVALDAGGRATVFLNQPADIRVEDAAGTTVATYKETGGTAPRVEVLNAGYTGTDPVSGAQVPGGRTYLDTVLSNLYTSFGGTDGRFLASSTATKRTVQSKFLELSVSVKDFGAVGNGVADDTAAIQAAVNYVAALGGGIAYVPPGTYLTSAAILAASNVALVGASRPASVIKNTNATSNAFTAATGFGTYLFRNITISHTSASSGYGIQTPTGTLAFDNAWVLGYTNAVQAATVSSVSSQFIGAGVGTGMSVATIAEFNSTFTSGTGSGLSVSSLGYLQGGRFDGGVGVDVTGSGTLLASGCFSTATIGLQTATTASFVLHSACNWGTVNDQRTGAPVNYTFAVDSAVTPLPNQTDTLRVRSTAAITVTVNAPPTMGFGRRWTMMCLNNSGGATIWTFNAVYKLSAAVAPAPGNMVSLVLEYDPISSIVREVGRAATAI